MENNLILLKIPNAEHRKNVIIALAQSGYRVWEKEKDVKDGYYGEKEYIIYFNQP